MMRALLSNINQHQFEAELLYSAGNRRLTNASVTFLHESFRRARLYSKYPLDILYFSAYQVSDHADRRSLNVTTGPLWQLRIANLVDIASYRVVRGKLRG